MLVNTIQKCEAIEDKLSLSFTDAKKTLWEFVCPTKECAKEWKEKIDVAMLASRATQHGYQKEAPLVPQQYEEDDISRSVYDLRKRGNSANN